MRFLLDHDVPDDLSYLLRHLGHEVTFLRQVLPRTASDAEILEHAFRETVSSSPATGMIF